MKFFASLFALLLAGSLPGFGTSVHHTSLNPPNQFHFKPTGRHAAKVAAHNINRPKAGHVSVVTPAHVPARKISSSTVEHSGSGKFAKNLGRHISNSPTGKIGFLSALQIPAGNSTSNAGTYFAALSGDFNGDGTPDIASEVETDTSGTDGYAISIVLTNGDGTFKQAVLTPLTDTCAALYVADINGDHKDDLIVGHQPNNCGNINTNPAFEVWLSNGDGTFTPSSNVNNTIPTTGVAGGAFWDVNGDQKLDIVLVDDGNPANVWTLLGNGDGTFQAPTSVALSGEVGGDAVLADFNGDGIIDIADNDYNTGDLTVYLASSATTYGTAATYLAPDNSYSPCGLSVGDLNGDGYPELVNVNCSYIGNNITVYVNKGDGTFGDNTGKGTYYDAAKSGGTNSQPAALYTYAITIADVNGDGNGDVIATNYYAGDVTVLLGNGDGTLTVPTMGYAVGGYPYEPAVATDFNGDGFVDIIIPDELSSFAYLRGYGDGTFRSGLNSYATVDSYSYSYDVATGDFNGDGHDDVVVTNYCSGCSAPIGVTVFLANPDGSLQSGVNYGSSNYYFAAVGDFNGDGKLDIAATDYDNNAVQLFNGDGTGNFTVGSTFDTDLSSNGPYGIWVGDFNNDGHPDLAIANWLSSDIAILLNDGSGNFQTPIPTGLNGGAWQGAALGDLDHDGNLDIVLPYWYGSSVGVLLGKGDGTFKTEQDLSIENADAVALADFNGDGKLDVAVTTDQGSGQDIYLALGVGDGTFGALSFVPSSLLDLNLNSSPDPQFIQAADVDGDGKVDLVYANYNHDTVGVLFGKGDGTFLDAVEYPAGGLYAWGLAVGDLNGDGAVDVVTSFEEYSAEAAVLLNLNGSATLGAYTIHSSAQGATVAAGSSATFTLTITPTNHYNGTITFTCPSGLPAGATCSFSPSSVKLDGLAPVTVKLTITTTGSAASNLHSRTTIDTQDTPRPRNSAMLLASLNGIGVFGMVLVGSLKKRTRQGLLAVLALGLMFFLVACGGSVNSRDTISTVTSSSPTASVGQTVTFTGKVISPSGFANGSVTFLDGNTTLGTGTLSGGSATFQTSSLAAGVHSITISYAGDSRFHASTSAVLSQTIGGNSGTPAGTYAITVSGAGSAGTNGVANGSQTIKVNVTVQ